MIKFGLLIFLGLAIYVIAIPFDDENRRLRLKRDITCAVGGNRVCNGTCMLRGWKEGACHWDTETGAFDCVCSPVRRGVRCNVGGATTCALSCHAIGSSGGICQNYDCICNDINNRWGDVLDDIKNRLK